MLKELLTLIKNFVTDDPYRTPGEKDFIKEYIDENVACDKSAVSHSCSPELMYSGFYNNIYNSFKFMYDIDNIINEIFCDGLTLNCSEALMNYCILLSTVSIDAMICIDDDFSFVKKYSLAKDIHTMAKAMYDSKMFIYTASKNGYSHNDVLKFSDYDDLESRLFCKYIRNGIAVLKLFHTFAILQVSPLHNDGVHKIAKELIHLLREILYNKRIIKIIVDTDINGFNMKFHKSTRIKIYFALGNSDRYCLRLDFPHQGEETIHLNINEPAHKQSTGFPFNVSEYQKVFSICKDDSTFNELFYFMDDLYWFKSNFAAKINKMGKLDSLKEQELKEFQQLRRHLTLFSTDENNIKSVSDFSAAFAEIMIEYEKEPIYGNTDTEDFDLYQYVLFQDYIFDTIIKLKDIEMRRRLFENSDFQLSICSIDQIKLKSYFSEYIKVNFSYDKKLNEYAESDMPFCEFISKCLDCIDQLGV